MKFLLGIPILALLTWFLYSQLGEDAQEALNVFKDDVESKLVKSAGEGEVALKLLQKDYASKKEQLIKLKSLKRNFERRIRTLESEADALEPDQAKAKIKLADSYQTKVIAIEEREKKAEQILLEFKTQYKETKSEIRLIQEEVAAAQALGDAMGANDALSGIEGRAEKVDSLISELHKKLDQAESSIEVSDLLSES